MKAHICKQCTISDRREESNKSFQPCQAVWTAEISKEAVWIGLSYPHVPNCKAMAESSPASVLAGDGEYEGAEEVEDDETTLDQEELMAAREGNQKVQLLFYAASGASYKPTAFVVWHRLQVAREAGLNAIFGMNLHIVIKSRSRLQNSRCHPSLGIFCNV